VTLRLRWLYFLVLFVWASPLLSAPGPQPRLVEEIDLEKMTETRTTVNLTLGPGVTLTISPPPNGMFGEMLDLAEKGKTIARIDGGKFMQCAKVEANSTTYWLLSEYSGGAHCCGVYHFFAKPHQKTSVRHLGETRGHNGGPLSLKKLLIFRDHKLFFQDMDNRFDYFHESHAGSLLVNIPETFYEVTPTSIKINNLPFKERYLKDAAATANEIAEAAAKRSGKPPAILKSDFGPGFALMLFSDDLGQLLVKRTIYYLYAREDKKAWETFSRDVKQYYQTTKWMDELKKEILAELAKGSY
jgi:hypothetical protein